MEPWRHVWREALAPLLSNEALAALERALRTDDKRLIQGGTTSPPPLQCLQDWPVEGACLIGYAGWVGEGLETVGEVDEFFASTCFDMDVRLGTLAVSRWLLHFFDDTPREEMIRQLLPEVQRTLAERSVQYEHTT